MTKCVEGSFASQRDSGSSILGQHCRRAKVCGGDENVRTSLYLCVAERIITHDSWWWLMVDLAIASFPCRSCLIRLIIQKPQKAQKLVGWDSKFFGEKFPTGPPVESHHVHSEVNQKSTVDHSRNAYVCLGQQNASPMIEDGRNEGVAPTSNFHSLQASKGLQFFI